MAIYDVRDENRRRVCTLRRTDYSAKETRFAAKYGKGEKLLPDARKLWRGKSGKRPVLVRRNGEVIRQIYAT